MRALVVGLGSIGRRHARNWAALGLGPVAVCRQTNAAQPEPLGGPGYGIGNVPSIADEIMRGCAWRPTTRTAHYCYPLKDKVSVVARPGENHICTRIINCESWSGGNLHRANVAAITPGGICHICIVVRPATPALISNARRGSALINGRAARLRRKSGSWSAIVLQGSKARVRS